MKKDAVAYINTSKISDFLPQKEILEKFCRYKFSVREIFHDNRVTSRDPDKREAFQKMLAYCKEHKIEHVVLYSLSGFSRNPRHLSGVFKKFYNDGIAVYWVEGDFLAGTEDPDLRMQAMYDFISFTGNYRIMPASRQTAKPGRPRALDSNGIDTLIQYRRGGMSISRICQLLSVSRSTVSKVLSDYPELKGEWKGSSRGPRRTKSE